MMKKILCLILVLATCSVASAATAWLEVDGGGTGFDDSTVITINVVSDTGVTGIGQLSIGTDGPLSAQAPLTMAPSFTTLRNLGQVWNAGGILTLNASGSDTTLPAQPVAPGTVLYSFDYHVSGQESDIIIIEDWEGTNPDGVPFPLATSISWLDGEISGTITDLGALEIHVTPEPMTIGLLGLGALGLLRRRRTA